MTHLQGPPGELRMTLKIKRAATGEEETVQLIGRATPAQLADIGIDAAKLPTHDMNEAPDEDQDHRQS